MCNLKGPNCHLILNCPQEEVHRVAFAKLKQKVKGKTTVRILQWFGVACGAKSYDFLHLHYRDTGP